MIARQALFETFAGRSEELRFLVERRTETARIARTAAVLIAGEAGIGKSRLIREFAATVERDRGSIVVVRCDPAGSEAFAPLARALDHVERSLRRRSLPAVVVAREALRAGAERAGDSAAELRRRPVAAFAAVLREASKRLVHLTLVVDDAHWADADSLEGLRHLISHARDASLLLVVAYRPEDVAAVSPLARGILALEREGADRMSLGPLPKARLLESLRSVLPAAPRGVLANILDSSDGRPYVAEELARSALEAGPDARVCGTIGLREAILERVLAMETSQRDVLLHAAVFGRRVLYADLAALGTHEAGDIVRALRAARDLQLIAESGSDLAPAFEFRHSIAREILYEELSAGRRRELHLDIAGYLEREAPERRAEIAYHLWSANDAARAVVACERAGDDAAAVAAFSDAATHYERGFSLDRGQPVTALGEKLVGALVALGDYERLIESAASVIERMAARGRRSEAAAACLEAVRALSKAHLPDAAGRYLELAADLVDSTASPGLRLEFALNEATLRIRQTRFDDARAALARAGTLMDYGGSRQRWRYVYTTAMHTYESNGGNNVPLAALEECLQFARAMPDRQLEIEALSGLGYVSFSDSYDTSLRYYEQTIALCAGDDALTWQLKANLATIAVLLGRLQRGQELVEEAERSGRISGLWTPVRVMLARYLGRDIEAFVALLDEPENASNVWIHAMVCSNASWVLEPSAARDLLHRGVDLLRPETYGGAFAHAVAVFGSDEDFERVRAALPERLSGGSPKRLGGARLFEACVARRQHRLLAAVEFARESFAFHEKVGDWLGCADALDVAGDTAGAVAIARKAGATGEVARFERRAGSTAAAAVRLTQREDQVVNLIAAGLSTREAGLRLGITSRTVENHLANAYEKLGIRSRRELAERLS